MQSLVIWNRWLALFHTCFALITLLAGNWNLQLPVYQTTLTFKPLAKGFDLVPTYVELGPMYITWVCASFFIQSAMAHAGNAFLWPDQYILWISRYCNPVRWIEYFFSASTMMLAVCYFCGMRDVVSLLYLASLISTTMLFGYVTEQQNVASASDDVWVTTLSRRLTPHLMGYIPQVMAWAGMVYLFLTSASEGGGPPDFVYGIVISQGILFFSFGFVQLFQILSPPSSYICGEYAYQVLSLVAKGLLGVLLLINVLVLNTARDLN